MSQYSLSYVLTTYNKLDFLRVAVPKAAACIKPDEELIVIDGGSTDGGAEYLQGLYERGLIQQFVSERDCGEGHGFNKAMLMAKGEVVKLLTDDDVFHFDAIGHCKDFMLANPRIDFLNTHGGWYEQETDNDIFMFTAASLIATHNWRIDRKPFAFCMLGAMLNRKSLPLLGLFNPDIKRADAEYSLRITSQKIKLAWYTGVTYVRILNELSNSILFSERIKRETEKLDQFYDVFTNGAPPPKDTRSVALRKRIHRLFQRSTATGNGHGGRAVVGDATVRQPALSIDLAFEKGENWMNDYGSPEQHEFICG